MNTSPSGVTELRGSCPLPDSQLCNSAEELADLLRRIDRPLLLVRDAPSLRAQEADTSLLAADTTGTVSGVVPPCTLENLGDSSFCYDHRLRYPYVGGSMAKGISSRDMVAALGNAGMLGFFGAAGLPVREVAGAIDELQRRLPHRPFGCNLIHSPAEPDLEDALVDLYLESGVHLVEASAFLALTLPVIRYRTHGIYRNTAGEIVTPNRIIAKISREEVAGRFFSPPPDKLLQQLVASGHLTADQAALAAQIPVAQDVTVEADSGGHTDNRPALALLPTILALKEQIQCRYNYPQPLRVGLGGGIATPLSAAAAFSMGAAYLVTGTVNQACIESGTCDDVRRMLAETRQADVTMAPSGDMFEMGVKVQVLKRGTMFAIRAHKLYELYRSYASIDDLPPGERSKLEDTIFRAPLPDIWKETRAYFMQRDPRQVEKAERDPKYLMALVFRWYLGQSPVWANRGEPSRKIDYQIWCGPAMGAFNEWVRSTYLEEPRERKVVDVALNILFGAAVQLRTRQLQQQGYGFSLADDLLLPLPPGQLKEYLS